MSGSSEEDMLHIHLISMQAQQLLCPPGAEACALSCLASLQASMTTLAALGDGCFLQEHRLLTWVA
jgi:hypothetical protein